MAHRGKIGFPSEEIREKKAKRQITLPFSKVSDPAISLTSAQLYIGIVTEDLRKDTTVKK